MHRSVRDLIGSRVVALNGKAGKAMDVLFGDRRWRMRFIDVETKPAFRLNLRYLSVEDDEMTRPSRVLLGPEQLEEPKLGIGRRDIPSRLSVEEVKSCQTLGDRLPVEAQYDQEYQRYFRHGIYGEKPPVVTPSGRLGYRLPESAYDHDVGELKDHVRRIKQISQEHVHSANAVFGYDLRDADGQSLGAVVDLILNTDSWTMEAIVVDTRKGIPSVKRIVPISAIDEIDWSRSTLWSTLDAESLEAEPRFVADAPVNHEQGSDRGFDYYGKPCAKEFWSPF